MLIAKLDRLARNVHFISGLMETGVPFVAADMPTATPFMLHVYAAMAEAEGIAISTRTKTALAAAKARGAKLGNPRLLAGSPGQARMVVTRDFSAHAIVYIIEATYISTGRGRSSVQLNLEHQVSDVLDTIRRRREADTGGHGAAATGVSDHPSIMHGWRRGRPPLYVPAHLPARGHGLTLVERGSIRRKMT